MVDSPGQPAGPSPLLETKLFSPRLRSGSVSRPRLIERLNQAADRKLTLVSAPAGSGKSTLLAEWLATMPDGERPAAWLSLDQSDNDPALFWAYVIAALQTLRRETGVRALSLLHSPQPAPIESVLTALINEINSIEGDFTLILDDFHVIDAQPVQAGVSFLLDHLPPRMHVVIASRSDPGLPLARLRGRGEMTELRAADLRFSAGEAAAFLNEMMGLELAPSDVAALETRTEGWIAGLQLAALSMRGREDIPEFIRAFAGDDRYIVDYLMEEVLQRQPERVRSFLLQTSILDRLSGPLCDAVTGQETGKAMLETLERDNLFVVPLDEKRHWYRFHHLFAEVLKADLIQKQPDQAAFLHRRASEWYEHDGLLADAVGHAFASDDFERVADLVEPAAFAIIAAGQEATVFGWIKELPEEILHVRPVLSVWYAWALLIGGDLEANEAHLQNAERWLEIAAGTAGQPHSSLAEMVVADQEEFESLPAAIASARAFQAQAIGDVAGVEAYAQRALDLLPESNYFRRASPAGILALAYWGSGELAQASRLLADSMAGMRLAGSAINAISGTSLLAYILTAQGRLNEAKDAYEQSLQIAAEQGEPAMLGTADLYVGLSELHLEQGDLQGAIQDMRRSQDVGEQAAQDAYEYRSRVAWARIKEVEGDLGSALDLLDDAERVFTTGVIPDVRPVAALKARLMVLDGRLELALAWARKRGLSIEDDISYLGEFEHITLAGVIIAGYKSEGEGRLIQEAVGLLDRLLKAAGEGERTGSTIEILVMLALAHAAQGNLSLALTALESGLTLGEPRGYLRIFLDEGEPMRDLLRQAAAAGIGGSYSRRLLIVLDEPAQSASSPVQAGEGLTESLTARELEILRLMAVGMRNQEIAEQLFISPSTVKRHIANAYGKLGVSHRTEAVARANEMNLL